MKVIVVGTGYVGLPHGAILAERGHTVWAYDLNKERITDYSTGNKGKIERHVNEPGLAAIIEKNLDSTLFFTTDISHIIDDVDVIFMCVNTPPLKGGDTDLSYYRDAAYTIAELLSQQNKRKRTLIVNKSTVPIGTARRLQGILDEFKVANVGVASNPEFLAQSKAIEGSRRPDRLVIGADTKEDFSILRELYSEFVGHVRIRYIETTPETAEAIKYVGNTLLLTYISFWNGVGAKLAETFNNIDMEDLRLGVTSDTRISHWGAYVSNGAGGSCFGKDIRSLIYQLKHTNNNTNFLQAVYNINEYQKHYLIERASDAGYNFGDKTIAVLGLTYKKQTNDMRDSAALNAIDALLGQGASTIHAYDPLANQIAQRNWFSPQKNPLYNKIKYFDSAQEAISGTTGMYISTDWEEFRSLSDIIKRTVSPPYLIIDGRRMISNYDQLVSAGYSYLPVGGMLQSTSIESPLPII